LVREHRVFFQLVGVGKKIAGAQPDLDCDRSSRRRQFIAERLRLIGRRAAQLTVRIDPQMSEWSHAVAAPA
jgi:hypothetical protein